MAEGMRITKAGRNLLAKALTGKELHFTRAFAGDGVLTSEIISDMTALISPKRELPIQSIEIPEGVGVCEIILEMNNADLSNGFFLREYGLFAQDPDTEEEILYSYRNVGDEASYLPGSVGPDTVQYTLDEVMLVKNQNTATKPDNIEAGLYCFRKIKSITGLTITLDKPVTEFSLNETDGDTSYRFKIHLVPNYTSVTIGANATVIPRATGDGTGGLVVFRCKGDVNIQGKILTSSYGMLRQDYFQMTHNHLPERFITARGGGVIILSEGTVTAGDNARIGASWSGAGKGGARVTGKGVYGNNGGSGYGASGTTGTGATLTSGAGGVGGGGGGGDNSGYTDAGNPGGRLGTGGMSSWAKNSYQPGTQGRTSGARGAPNEGGGGALGDSCTWKGILGISGSCVMIICKKLKVSMNAISTGGKTGSAISSVGIGGGGCGMCYLAYEEAE